MKLHYNARLALLGVLVSALALAFIVTQINLELFVRAIVSARYAFIVPCVVLLVLGLVTRALRWQALLNGAVPLGRAFSIMNIAYLVNGVLPLRLGEVARMALTARGQNGIPVAQTAATIVVERLLDLLAVVLLLAFALVNGQVPPELRAAGVTSGALALVGFAVLLVLAQRRDWAEKALHWGAQHVPMVKRLPFDRWLLQFLEGLKPLTQARTLIRALTWTGISWGFSVAAGYVLMFALYDSAQWTTTALYIASAALAIALPAVPGNVGTYEASILLALQAMGYVLDGRALAFAVLVHAVNVFVHGATGVLGFFQERLSWEQLRLETRRMQES